MPEDNNIDNHDRLMPASRAHRLDAPERLRFLPPDTVLNLLALKPGAIVADVGAGTGYFSLPIADAVGPEGRVFAIDIQQEMQALLREKLQRAGTPKNIDLVLAPADSTPLADETCDVVFLANVWHELPNHVRALNEFRRILKPGGTVAILDWRPDTIHPPGPPIEHRIAPEKVHRDLESNAFACQSTAHVGTYSYLVIGVPLRSASASEKGTGVR
jgi:ubiquinone/menaquinone biosynthesis C-methylase UbiE